MSNNNSGFPALGKNTGTITQLVPTWPSIKTPTKLVAGTFVYSTGVKDAKEFFCDGKTYNKRHLLSAILAAFKYFVYYDARLYRKGFKLRNKDLIQETLVSIYDRVGGANDDTSVAFLQKFRNEFIKEFRAYDIFFYEGEFVDQYDRYLIEKKVLLSSSKKAFFEKYRKLHPCESSVCLTDFHPHNSEYNDNQNIIDIMILPNNQFVFRRSSRDIHRSETYAEYIKPHGLPLREVIFVDDEKTEEQLKQCIAKGLCAHNPKFKFHILMKRLDTRYILTMKEYYENPRLQDKYCPYDYFICDVRYKLFPDYEIEYAFGTIIQSNSNFVIKDGGYAFDSDKPLISVFLMRNYENKEIFALGKI